MRFKGVGIVKWKDRVIANFMDGYFETSDPGVIQRLQMLDFPEVKDEIKKEIVEPSKPEAPKKKGKVKS